MTITQKIDNRKIRASAQIAHLAADMAQHEHDRNYWRCQVWPDGEVDIAEAINRDERSVLPDNMRDDSDDNIQCAQVLAIVGTGSFDCDCDACRAGCDGSECCGDDDATEIEQRMIDALAEIGDEYFSR